VAERVTKVTLTAQVAQYIAGMDKAAKATKETASEAEKLAKQGDAIAAMGRSMLTMGTVAAVGVGLAVSKFADFDKAMSNVQAATHESTENMAALRDAAVEAGRSTVYSASESAQAIEELGKAGISTADTLSGGLNGALSLAAAGQLEVGRSAEVAASALTQFNLAGKDVPHVADVLAAGAGKAQGSVEEMSQALGQSGLVASQMGLSLEDTVGSLSAFASAGLIGSDAGTSFRSMLLRLANPTDEAREAMKKLGVSAYDAGGNFVGMESLAGQLQKRLGGLTQAQRDQNLALIFGQDAIRAANILYREGAEGISDWTDKVNDAGYASETAEKRLDNLAGDLEKLGGAFDTALIQSGSAANDVMRAFVQTSTDAVDAFADAPDGVQATALAIGSVTAAVGLAGGAFLVGVPKVAAFRTALATMGTTAQTTATALGALGKSLGVVGAAAAGAVAVHEFAEWLSKDLVPSASEVENVFKGSTSALERFKVASDTRFGEGFTSTKEATKQLGMLDEALQASADSSANLGIAVQGMNGEVLSTVSVMGKQYAELASTDLPAAQAGFRDLLEYTDGTAKSQWRLINALGPEFRDALTKAASAQGQAANKANLLKLAMGNTAPATKDAAEKVDEFAEATDGAKESLDQFIDSLRNLGNTQLTLEDSQERVAAATDAFKKSLEENGATLDVNTEAGRANRDAVQEIARAYAEQAAATVEATGKQEDAIPIIQKGRDEVIKARQALGESKEEAEKYADSLGLIPDNVQTQITANWDEAMAKARQVAKAIEDIPGYRDVVINEVVMATGAARGEVRAAYADGGPVTGPGGPRDDRVLARLSAGEFVVNAAAAKANRPWLDMINSGTETTNWGAFNAGRPTSSSTYAYGGSSYQSAPPVEVNMPSNIRLHPADAYMLREIRDAARASGVVPVDAVQGAFGSNNVRSTRLGQGS